MNTLLRDSSFKSDLAVRLKRRKDSEAASGYVFQSVDVYEGSVGATMKT